MVAAEVAAPICGEKPAGKDAPDDPDDEEEEELEVSDVQLEAELG